jgi:hypothetical protein
LKRFDSFNPPLAVAMGELVLKEVVWACQPTTGAVGQYQCVRAPGHRDHRFHGIVITQNGNVIMRR